MKLFLPLLLLVAGCSMWSGQDASRVNAPRVGEVAEPMAYQFRITKFADARPATDDVRGQLLFPQEHFLRAVQQNLRANIFDSRPAKLRLKVTHYAFTSYNRDYTMSMAVKMHGVSDLEKDVVNQEFTCAIDKFGSALDLKTLVEELPTNPNALTKEGWQARVEGELVKRCVNQMMLDFSRTVTRSTSNDEEEDE
ncbi:MAG: hypothetical protein WAX89_05010 [Alphaproteobacteria bacterium]